MSQITYCDVEITLSNGSVVKFSMAGTKEAAAKYAARRYPRLNVVKSLSPETKTLFKHALSYGTVIREHTVRLETISAESSKQEEQVFAAVLDMNKLAEFDRSVDSGKYFAAQASVGQKRQPGAALASAKAKVAKLGSNKKVANSKQHATRS
jgi:non-homologous end joining protein Ku